MLDSTRIAHLQQSLRGELIYKGSPGYEHARALYNGMIDKYPALIACCRDVADVIAAVNFGRDHELVVAVRGGGHNGAGLGSCDDGLVIDLGALKGIRVDPVLRTIRAEAGCTQGDLDHAGSAFRLAVPAGIVSTTGISGLTLGGGHGYLSRRYGLTIDNLLEADVVLADGRFVTASERENADLFWALRGGGGNFGVVTSFLFRAHPVSNVYAGPVFWDIEHAAQIMRVYREFLPTAPEKLSPFLGLKTVPSTPPFPKGIWGKRVCAIISCYDGTEQDGIRALRPLREALPEPILDGMATMPYTAIQSLFDGLLPKGLQWYWKGDFVRELSDAAIDAHIEYASKSPSELSLMHLYPIDGAVHRVGSRDMAWSCRDARWSMVICGIDANPEKAAALKSWARDYWEAVHRFNPGGAYVNFMMDDEGDGRLKATYGANFERLTIAKRRYDPENLFRTNLNIPPHESRSQI